MIKWIVVGLLALCFIIYITIRIIKHIKYLIIKCKIRKEREELIRAIKEYWILSKISK